MEYLVTGWFAALRAMAWLVFFLGAALAAGGCVFGAAPGVSRAERTLFSIAAGLVLLSLATLFLGFAGKLSDLAPVLIAATFYIPFLFSDSVRLLFLPAAIPVPSRA